MTQDLQIGKTITPDEYLKGLIGEGVSDIHLKAHRPPLVRRYGVLHTTEEVVLTEADIKELAKALLSESMWSKFKSKQEIETSYSIPGCTRLRLSVFRQRGSISLAIRILSFDIPTIAELNLPPIAERLAMSMRGLVLITGVTGSGKSSTLAAMINHVNHSRACHIITIEDPIEFLHKDDVSAINQREVGVDTETFAAAFRSALRQDPDIILVGELRDTETMEIALQAAETGHLVLSTLHTTDAKETIGRFVDSFPSDQQKNVRIQLAASLAGVISQRLIERSDKGGRVLATEVMINTAAIQDLIIEPERSGEILGQISKGDHYGMHTFDQSIYAAYQRGDITEAEAIRYATSPNDFKVRLHMS